MLALGRGLASVPDLLMLDEPSMGLAPTVVDQIFDSILKLHRERQLTILLVEQRAAEALEGCHHGYVLETGRIVLAGSGDELLGSPLVRDAYLGLS
jgi:branched-chain amino acid transport system ATP-binding protein